ncbi:AAA domain-containing protein [Amycolatopsis sp. EV170708-02-1]|uniref:AAA domain-containing protein n=1 Tax=Amycolatopsis sp. EV170708-02-1 TaxID=2919322 RepID=UPI001F0CC29F|nr:AAA domain-containing protein [Amycolatopsis sp. EV170708-02-1]UMP03408.1 AAA domain-containing protein [Amycolatopsis sp. EV170708-02-1]
MIDPRTEAVLIRDRQTGVFKDETSRVARYEFQPANQRIRITFTGQGKVFPYGQDRVQVLRNAVRRIVTGEDRVEVDGALWESATETVTFSGVDGAWCRVFYRTRAGESYRTYPAAQVRVITSGTAIPLVNAVLNYWRAIVSRLDSDDPLRSAYDRLAFVHPESVLSSYLTGAPIASRPLEAVPIFPFRCNLSQREAVENALSRSISVIEGPPGTGKTETILNLIANITAVQHKTVGIVSFGNAAVDNVRDKLDELGFGHVLGNLGRKEKREEFFTRQSPRNAAVSQFVSGAPQPPDPRQLADLDRRLRDLQEHERFRADRRQALDAHRLELRHFEGHLNRVQLPDLEKLPLLRKSADRIIDYLAESQLELTGSRPRILRRLRNYFKYGSLRALDKADTDVVLRLQLAYYTKRIAELEHEVELVDARLQKAAFEQIAQDHQRLSIQLLHAELADRYRKLSRTDYKADSYRNGRTFATFMEDYPALLSTCHSLRASIADGYLLDYLIIDEASQVNLLLAGLAMSCARNVIVVGDQKQLPPIPVEAAADLAPPMPAYDCRRHNLLSSLSERYGAELPSALLREHYRCDPAIIGFCNKKFYDGELIPYTTSGAEQPMIVVRTVEGNHMRRHHTGGRSNQREVDVISQEVIRDHCRGFTDADIGITTPYRLQADKTRDVLDQIQADTVHRFQGRQKQVVILTTVLDETWRGHTGLPFVDDPQMINVAVSRAVRRFILVTNHAMMPTSRHIQDLVGYIRYHNPGDEVVDSTVVSVFDLLYKAYSQRLRPLAARLRKERKYLSEDIIWTVLHDIFAERRYAHLTAVPQVLLKNLLPDLDRLNPAQAAYVKNRASLDFVVYNRVTNQPLLPIEVDGFAFHENKPAQLARDALKNEILRVHDLPLLRLPTTGSGEQQRILDALGKAEDHWARRSAQ